MFKLVYYNASSGRKETLAVGSEKATKASLDSVIDNSRSPVRTVRSDYVEFRNGDIARVVSMVPLSAIMLTREDRGFYNDGAESIFE